MSAEFWAASLNSNKDAAADRRTAREASLCLDSPRIYQQSHEGAGRRCCAGLSRLPQELDHSPHSAELGHWNSSHQCGVCTDAARIAWVWRALQTGAERDEGAGTEQNRHRFAAPRQTVGIGRKIWTLLSPSQELARARSNGPWRPAGRVPLPAQYTADVPEEREGPNFEAV